MESFSITSWNPNVGKTKAQIPKDSPEYHYSTDFWGTGSTYPNQGCLSCAFLVAASRILVLGLHNSRLRMGEG